MEESKYGVLTEIFTGSGNQQDDAKSIAEVRYDTWRKSQRKRGVKFKEIEKTYSYDEKSSVYCKCTLTVSYTLTKV